MGKPSIFSNNYAKRMKKRKIRYVIIIIIIIAILFAIFFNSNIKKMVSIISDSKQKNTTINNKDNKKPSNKKFTDKPSRYNINIKATNTMAKPVSSCSNLIISKGTPSIKATMMVFL